MYFRIRWTCPHRRLAYYLVFTLLWSGAFLDILLNSVFILLEYCWKYDMVCYFISAMLALCCLLCSSVPGYLTVRLKAQIEPPTWCKYLVKFHFTCRLVWCHSEVLYLIWVACIIYWRKAVKHINIGTKTVIFWYLRHKALSPFCINRSCVLLPPDI